MGAESFTLTDKTPRKTVFLDRDGVLNVCAPPHAYIRTWEEFRFLPGAVEGVRKLNEAGFLVLVVTNQRGVARGMLSLEDVNAIHRRMLRELERQGARIDGVYVCSHNEGECSCRKPKIGLFLQAEAEFCIDKSASWMVGDSWSDEEAGRRYGVNVIRTDNLLSAAEQIISRKEDGVK